MSEPIYNHLNEHVPPDEWTPAERAIMTATSVELSERWTQSAVVPHAIAEAMSRQGWHARLTTPFTPSDLSWAGFTPHGISGWNGSPDHHVGDETLLLATLRAALLALLERE